MADLEGGLLELRPATLLEFLAATEKTGMLRVQGRQEPRRTITVWVERGVAVAAESTGPDTDLLDQLVDLIRTPAGTFRFTEGDLPRPEQTRDPDPELLPRAVARLHEWEDIAEAVPSLSLVVKLVNDHAGEEVMLSSSAWSVSVAVSGGHTSIDAVAKHLRWSSFRTCKAVRELVDAGRATLTAPPKRRRGGHPLSSTKVEAPGVWHPSNQPLWPGSGGDERDRFSSAWAYEE